MPTELQKVLDWAKGVSFAVTVCDCEGFIIYMNDKSKATFAKHGDMIGNNLKECHPAKAWKIITTLLEKGGSNSYTIYKNGVKKIIHQTPWYKNGNSASDASTSTIGGLVEISIVIPQEMPHYIRG
ncbi:MAG: PAS sensor protein [Bacteroidales bacterium]